MSPLTPAYLLDASIYIFRYYFSLPDNWFSEDDLPTAAVYGYTTFLLQLIEKRQPTVIAACYDESLNTCFRNTLYPDYKSSRELPDPALAFQLNSCKKVGELMGIASFASTRYEADDLIGTLAATLRKDPTPIAILTRDKDLGQLIQRPQDFMWDPKFKSGNDGGSHYQYDQDIIEKFGVKPSQLVDYLALLGDSIDDIPGVPGIGAKTAAGLLQAHKDILEIFRNIDQLHTLPIRGAGKLADKLIEHTKQIAMARQLAQIVENIPLGVTRSDLELAPPDLPALQDLFQSLGFSKNLYQRAEKVLTEPGRMHHKMCGNKLENKSP